MRQYLPIAQSEVEAALRCTSNVSTSVSVPFSAQSTILTDPSLREEMNWLELTVLKLPIRCSFYYLLTAIKSN